MGYPMCIGLKKHQRIEILEKVKEACLKFTGQLEGTFYSYDSMGEDQQKQLMNDFFLFK